MTFFSDIKLWAWLVPVCFSNCKRRFQGVLCVFMLGITCIVLMVGGMLVHYMSLYPTLAFVDVGFGQLTPDFHPHTFHYNILVDRHVKGDNIRIALDEGVAWAYRVRDMRKAIDTGEVVPVASPTPGDVGGSMGEVYM